MKKFLLILLAGMLSACSSVTIHKHGLKVLPCRITFYNNHEDKYGSKIACGGRAVEGHTVAAHPDFAFGTQLFIPALKPLIGSSEFVVEDRGSAVTSKKASTFGEYVFDVYLYAKNRRQGKARIRELGSEITHADVYVR